MTASERSPRGIRAPGRALALLGGAIILAACGEGAVASTPNAEPSPTPDFTPWEMPTPEPTPPQAWSVPVRNDGAEPVRLIVAGGRTVALTPVGTAVPELVQPGDWLDVVLSGPTPTWRTGPVYVSVQVGTAEDACEFGWEGWGGPTEVYVDAAGRCWVGAGMAQQGGPLPLGPLPSEPFKPVDRGFQ